MWKNPHFCENMSLWHCWKSSCHAFTSPLWSLREKSSLPLFSKCDEPESCGLSVMWSVSHVIYQSCGLSVMLSVSHVIYQSCGLSVTWSICHVIYQSCDLSVMLSVSHVIYQSHDLSVMWSFCHGYSQIYEQSSS